MSLHGPTYKHPSSSWPTDNPTQPYPHGFGFGVNIIRFDFKQPGIHWSGLLSEQ